MTLSLKIVLKKFTIVVYNMESTVLEPFLRLPLVSRNKLLYYVVVVRTTVSPTISYLLYLEFLP